MKSTLVATPFGRLLRRMDGRRKTLSILFWQPHNILGTVNGNLAREYVYKIAPHINLFVDVGAHIGSVGGEALLANPKLGLILVEPIEWKAAKLRQKFPAAEVKCCAIGAEVGEAEFYIDREMTANSSLRRASGQRRDTVRVPVTTLDVAAAGRSVDFVKIDVEGAEIEVLDGGREVLTQSRPIILFESGPPGCDEELDRIKAVWQCLEKYGYDILAPNRIFNHASGMSLEAFIDSHQYPWLTLDYFAIPKERREDVRRWLKE